MLKDITLGQYYPTKSVLHKMDPRVKIMYTFVFMIGLFMLNSFFQYGLVVVFIGVIIKLSNIPAKHVLKGIKPLWPLLLITFLINSLLTQGEPIFQMWVFKLTKEGLIQGSFMIIRLVLLIGGTSLLTLTTAPIELTDGIEKLLKPFEKIKLPAHEIAMMMTIALRFIPTLLEETDKIMKAQMARGADFESKNIIQRAKSLVPLLVPLFVSAFRRADELAMAMEARCYRGGVGRTRMNELELENKDYKAFAIGTIIMIAIVAIRFI